MVGGEGFTTIVDPINHVTTEYNSIPTVTKKEQLKNIQVGESLSTVIDEGIRRRNVIHIAKETLDKASRLLRKKMPYTGHLMTPRRLWIQKVPTQECDVVITFPSNNNDETLMWFLARFRAENSGLIVHVRHHASTNNYGLYLTAPFSVLLKVAEEVHLPKRLRQEFGGGLKEFIRSEATCFEDNNDEIHFFTTMERQSLILHLLHTLRAGPYDLNSLPGLKIVDGQAIIPQCLSSGIISQVFPLHELPALEKLQLSWVRAFMSSQPLDDISSYFGVKITMYFAWLGHYTAALIIPAAVGIVFWVGIIGRNQALEDVAYVLFSVFNVIWATIYLETWKRKSAELAYRWGTLDQRNDLLVEPRPLFTGNLEISPVTGRLEPTYPRWKRNVFRYFISVPIVVICIFFVFIVMIFSFQIQDWWDTRLQASSYNFWLTYVPKVLLAIFIAVMDEAYFKLAVWLNDLENYRLDTEYENHLIYKMALFQFVNSFLSLFYIAFYIQDQERLKEQLATLLITRQVIGNLKESAIPYIIEQLKLARLSFELFGALSPSEARFLPNDSTIKESESTPTINNENSRDHKTKQPRNISQAELESSLYRYDGAFSEHLEMLAQLGYVCLFSSAFPLAAFAALLGNFLELRGNAFKICFIFQRPFGRRVSNIGTWQNAMEAMGLMAILVNCALIGLSGQAQRMFPKMSTTQTILLIVALEHIMLAIRFIIICAIPDIPNWLATEMAKVEFLRRKVAKTFSTTTTSSEHQPTTTIGRFVVSATGDVFSGAKASKQKQQHYTEELLNDWFNIRRRNQSSTRLMPPSSAQTSSGSEILNDLLEHYSPITVSKIVETPELSAKIFSSTDRGSESCKLLLTDITVGTLKDFNSLPRGSIPEGEKARKSKECITNEKESSGSGDYGHHLTIGPHGGIDWIRHLGTDNEGHKSNDLEISDFECNIGDKSTLHRWTDCVTSKDLAASSDSDLLRSIPPWSPSPKNQKVHVSQEKDTVGEKVDKQQYQQHLQQMQQYQLHQDSVQEYRYRQFDLCEKEKERNIICDFNKLEFSQEDEKSMKEDREAKKTRVKQSLMKRARSVAIFSLKLKERRARDAEIKAKEADRESRWRQPEACVGGELSCIPIEKLISVDDITTMETRKINN